MVPWSPKIRTRSRQSPRMLTFYMSQQQRQAGYVILDTGWRTVVAGEDWHKESVQSAVAP